MPNRDSELKIKKALVVALVVIAGIASAQNAATAPAAPGKVVKYKAHAKKHATAAAKKDYQAKAKATAPAAKADAVATPVGK